MNKVKLCYDYDYEGLWIRGLTLDFHARATAFRTDLKAAMVIT